MIDAIRGVRALVTGGAGFIGSHIADDLVAGGAAEVVVFDDFSRGREENLAQAAASGRVAIVRADIRDRRALASAMRGIDVVFHQAALRITRCADEPRAALEVLVDGSFNVADAARSAGVRKIVAASSASVYGLADAFPTGEAHHPYNNRTFYGAAKSFTEGLLRSFHDMYGLDYVALRYFNVYGPRMDIHGAYTEVFVRWLDGIAAGSAPMIFGDAGQTMDLIDVRDVARANVLAAVAPATDVVCNVGSGRETTLAELARALAASVGATVDPIVGPPRRVNPVPRRIADVTRARERLGFVAEIGLEEGLADLAAWWRRERAVPAA